MSRLTGWHVAGLMFLLHVALVLACQATTLSRTSHGVEWLGLKQADTLLVSLVMVGLWRMVERWRVGRLGVGALVGAVLCYALLDTIYVRLFSQHFNLPALEDVDAFRNAILLEALLTELNAAFVVLAVAWLLGTMGLLALLWGRRPRGMLPPRWAAGVILVTAVQVVTTYGMEAGADLMPVASHPLVWLIRTSIQVDNRGVIDASNKVDIKTPRYPQPPRISPEQQQVLSSMKGAASGLNLVVVILESVGARQLLGMDGRPDETRAPNLARWAQSGVVFSRIYNTYPATTRTHLAIMTGGFSVLTGLKRHVVHHRYMGATLPGMLNQEGYQTAMFSAADLTYENLGIFYQNMPWNLWVAADYLPKEDRERHDTSMWGVDEGFMVDQVQSWLRVKPDGPFFLLFLTAATHYPYSVPEGFPKSFPSPDGSEHKPRYLAALHYTDAMLGRLERVLEEAGVLDHTVLAVMGDHGESFGETHKDNHLHKGHLYDENIRNFLLLYAPSHPVRMPPVENASFIGDVTPTLTTWLGMTAEPFGGVSLWEPARPRVFYFHKSEVPDRFGLLDGTWKFTTTVHTKPAPELYDLSTDPLELHNVAHEHPDMVAEMSKRCLHWSVGNNEAFEARQE